MMKFKNWLPNFTTLRWRLTLYYAGLVCVLVSGLGVFTYNRLESFAEDSVRRQLLNYPLPPIPSPPPPPANFDPYAILQQYSSQVARQGVRDTTVTTWVLDWNGKPVPPTTTPASSGQEQTTVSESFGFQPTTENLQQARKGGTFYTIQLAGKTTTDTKTEPVTALAYLSVIPGSDRRPWSQPAYVLRIKPLTEIREILDQMRVLLLGGLAGVLLLAVLLGLPLARIGLHPINKVTSIARQTRGGDLSKRVELSKQASRGVSKDEVWQMAHEFNAMLDQLEEAFKAQRESEKRTRQFVADASHELRSPLTILGGYVDVMAMGAKNDPERADQILNSMRAEITRLSRLVTDLLTLTRLDQTSQASLKIGPVRLADLLRRAYDNFKVLGHQRRLELNILAELEDSVVLADSDRLYQVIANLLDNAIRYTSPDGQIIISLMKPPKSPWVARRGDELNQLLLVIADNGCGIEAEHLPHIFDRFYRADRSRSRNTGNWGLGLAISKSIVEAHHGTIQAESVAGKGTTFLIHLPASTPHR
jgi:signal transduction histidine kinase